MMETQRQGHVDGGDVDVCVPLGGSNSNLPFKQKLDMDLKVKSENSQQIGKKYIVFMQVIQIYNLDMCEIKQVPFHTNLLYYFFRAKC